MNPDYALVARKYAQAFMAVAGDTFNEHEFRCSRELKRFLRKNRALLFHFGVPLVTKDIVEQALDLLYRDFKTCAALFKQLTRLLIKHHRIVILPDVLHHLGDLYKEQSNSMFFYVISSHDLDQHQIRACEEYVAGATGKKIVSEYFVDKELIAGIRLQSDTFLWEHSVRKQLQAVQQSLIA